jgi:phage/plasmid-associated DNA primase
MQKSAAFKMLNYDDDLNDQSIRQIDVIKKWVTQSEFTARGIYEQPTTFRPMSRLMFSANDLYEIPNADDAEAIYDRTYLVRIDKKYRHRDGEIKNVMKKVATDEQLDGFLTYLLQNAFWIANEEKYHHPISLSTVESIWNTLGNRIKEFKKKWIVDEPSYRLDSNDPFNKWSEYCITNNYHAKSKKEFKEIFDELVGNTPTKTRKKLDGSEESVEIYAYTGIRLKTDEEIQEEEQNKIDPSESEEALKALIFLSLSLNFKTFNKIKNSMKSTELLELGEES